MSAVKIDRGMACMSYIRIATHYGYEAVKKAIWAVKNSAPFKELDDSQRAAVLAYGAGRLDAFYNVKAPVSSQSFLLVVGEKN